MKAKTEKFRLNKGKTSVHKRSDGVWIEVARFTNEKDACEYLELMINKSEQPENCNCRNLKMECTACGGIYEEKLWNVVYSQRCKNFIHQCCPNCLEIDKCRYVEFNHKQVTFIPSGIIDYAAHIQNQRFYRAKNLGIDLKPTEMRWYIQSRKNKVDLWNDEANCKNKYEAVRYMEKVVKENPELEYRICMGFSKPVRGDNS